MLDRASCFVCSCSFLFFSSFNPFALRKAKIVYNFGLSEGNRVNKIKIVKKVCILLFICATIKTIGRFIQAQIEKLESLKNTILVFLVLHSVLQTK